MRWKEMVFHHGVEPMKIYDISRELFSAPVYPGDPSPQAEWLDQLKGGGECNLSSLYCGSHNGTHVDAPLHYIEQGASVDKLALLPFMGPCVVVSVGGGEITMEQVRQLLPKRGERILFRGEGKAYLHPQASVTLAQAGVALVGMDALSIGSADQEQEAHLPLLEAGIPILEGLDLFAVPDGTYFLVALPLKLGGLEASPVRAVLLEQEKNDAKLL